MKKYFFILLVAASVNLLAQNNTNIDNKFRLAQTYEMNGLLDKAEPLYKELIQLQVWNYTYFESLNRVLVLQKKYDESISLIEQRIKTTPNDAGLFGMLGTTYFYSDNTIKAFESWERGIATNPNSFITYRIIANAAIENRAFEKAIDFLKRGKAIAEDKFPFMIDLSNIYAINMNFTDAAAELCELVEIRPEQLPTAKARLSSFINRPLAAEQSTNSVKNYLEKKETAELYDFLAFVFFQTGKVDEALNTITKLEKKFNGNGNNTILFAQEAFRSRKFGAASRAYKFLLDNFPNSPYELTAHLGYAKTLEESLNQRSEEQIETWKPFTVPKILFAEDYKKIIEAFENFIKTFKDNGSSTEALFRIAEVYRCRLLDQKNAENFYNQIIKTSPMTNYAVDSYIALGKIALDKNKLDEAKQFFENATNHPRSEPAKSFEAKFILGKISFWKGEFSKAAQTLKDATTYFSADFTNDALELAFIINTAKKDSANLLHYAKADLLLLQNNLKLAAVEFKTLGDNDNLFIINQFAKMKLAEVFLAENDFSSALPIIEKLSKDENLAIFAEKSTFLLANTYFYGIRDSAKAAQTYQKLLENFPNSIYFDRARVELNRIQTKNG